MGDAPKVGRRRESQPLPAWKARGTVEAIVTAVLSEFSTFTSWNPNNAQARDKWAEANRRARETVQRIVFGELASEPALLEKSMDSASLESADDPMWKGGRRYENEECARVAEQYQRDVEASIQPRLTGQSLEGYNSIANFERGRVQAARDMAALIRRRPIAAAPNSCVDVPADELTAEAQRLGMYDRIPRRPWRAVEVRGRPGLVNVVSDEPDAPCDHTMIVSMIPKDSWFVRWLLVTANGVATPDGCVEHVCPACAWPREHESELQALRKVAAAAENLDDAGISHRLSVRIMREAIAGWRRIASASTTKGATEK